MSMQIEFNDNYNETTYYFGTVKEPEPKSHGEHNFTVVVAFFSTNNTYTITEIIWDGLPDEKDKAEKRISEMVHGWHRKKGDIRMQIKLGDKNAKKI